MGAVSTFLKICIASAAAALVAGCGSDPLIHSSNRGAGSHTGQTSVENAFIVPRFVPGSCAIQVGDAAALAFTVTNNRVTEAERLLAIESPAAEAIHIIFHRDVGDPAGTSIAAGQSIEHIGDDADDRPFTVRVAGLRESARPGTSVDMTFRFEKHGDLTMRVAVEACPTQD
jgi:copper(I)-binding protein